MENYKLYLRFALPFRLTLPARVSWIGSVIFRHLTMSWSVGQPNLLATCRQVIEDTTQFLVSSIDLQYLCKYGVWSME